MNELVTSLAQNSFSVVVAAYLLVRLEKELRHLSGVIERLCHCQTCKVSPLNSSTEGEK
jgi:hypothetical protein